MTQPRKTFAPLLALMALMLTPTHAMAARYVGWTRMLGDFFEGSGSGILATVLLVFAAIFILMAVFDPDWLHENEDNSYLMRLIGRQGRRAVWLGAGIFLLSLLSQTSGSDTMVDEEMAMQRCGAPGTHSYINDDGFCDCPDGFTWADEADETSVVCMVESNGARGS